MRRTKEPAIQARCSVKISAFESWPNIKWHGSSEFLVRNRWRTKATKRKSSILSVFRLFSQFLFKAQQQRQLLRAHLWSGLQKYHTINFAQKPFQMVFDQNEKDPFQTIQMMIIICHWKIVPTTHHLIASWNGNMYI